MRSTYQTIPSPGGTAVFAKRAIMETIQTMLVNKRKAGDKTQADIETNQDRVLDRFEEEKLLKDLIRSEGIKNVVVISRSPEKITIEYESIQIN